MSVSSAPARRRLSLVLVLAMVAWLCVAATAAGPSLAATLSWNDSEAELFDVFPFRHELRYEAGLSDGRLQIALTVDACGADVAEGEFKARRAGVEHQDGSPGAHGAAYTVQ